MMVGLAPRWLIEDFRLAKQNKCSDRTDHVTDLLAHYRLFTVCQSARCPNRGECFSNHTATFLILGDICTRSCAFCAIECGKTPGPLDEGEPARLAQAVNDLNLQHVVITSVTRDDLPDGGAYHYARVVETLRQNCPGVKIELLVPDFAGSENALAKVLSSRPDVLSHNLETVPRLYPIVRKGAVYARSLNLLKKVKTISEKIVTKSGLMLGLGENNEEVESVLGDLRDGDCDMLTLGQYLAPSFEHATVARYLTRSEFGLWNDKARKMGFKSVASGPLVRSSYKAAACFGGMR